MKPESLPVLIDANILLYAQDEGSAPHTAARDWWDHRLSEAAPVCLSWSVLGAFLRISTNPRVYEFPLDLEEACSHVQRWLDQPCTRIVSPTDRHWETFQKMLVGGKAVGNLIPDAHLAALAVEHGCELISTDSDFSRFPGLKWRNPL